MQPLAAKTTRIRITENADACANCISVMHSRMRVVKSDQWTDTRKMVALMAVIARMKRNFMPAVTAGMMSGNVTLRNVPKADSPRDSDASSSEGSICCREATVERIPVAS